MAKKTPSGGSTECSTDGDCRLREWCSSAGAAIRVDREASVIHGVKILGAESKNNRTYTPAALTAAVKLYEGKPVNFDHVDGSRRSYRDRAGRLSKVELRADGLYGSLQINPKHPLAEQLFWDAEHSPESVGLSHDAKGRTVVRGGRVIVEQINSVRSVDLVADPATTNGLYESEEAGGTTAVADEEGEIPDKGEAGTSVDKLPDGDFALVLPGGVKLGEKTHPLHKRRWPLDSKERVTRALKQISANRSLAEKNREQALQRARAAAKKFRINVNKVLGITEALMSTDLEKLTIESLKESRPDLVAELQAAGDSEKQLLALKEDRDAIKAKLEAIERKEKVAAELKEAKVEATAVPASLMESLLSAADDKRKAMVADLAKMLVPQPGNGKPVSQRSGGGGSTGATYDERVAAWRN